MRSMLQPWSCQPRRDKTGWERFKGSAAMWCSQHARILACQRQLHKDVDRPIKALNPICLLGAATSWSSTLSLRYLKKLLGAWHIPAERCACNSLP